MSLSIYVFRVTYDLVIHCWIKKLDDNGIVCLDLDNDHTWELRCSFKPERITTEVTMQGDRPADHMIEAEVRRLNEPSWLNVMRQKNGYQYSVKFIEIRSKTVGELIKDQDANWQELTEHYREPVENILPRRKKR